jgi:site-specific recombinase XerC
MRHAAISEVMKGIRSTKGTAQARKSPLLAAQLIRALATMRTDLVGLRDRALLLIGFSGAFRRSELVALDVADVEAGEDGITVTLRRSKADQEGAARLEFQAAQVRKPVRHEHCALGGKQRASRKAGSFVL